MRTIAATNLHEGSLKGEELAQLDGRCEDGDREDVVVVRVDRECRIKGDVLVASEMLLDLFDTTDAGRALNTVFRLLLQEEG